MNHSNHGRRLLSAAAVVLGNAGYSLTVALFLEPRALWPGVHRRGAGLWPLDRAFGLRLPAGIQLSHAGLGLGGTGPGLCPQHTGQQHPEPHLSGLAETMLHGRVLTDDLFLNTVFAAIGVGAFMGIVIRAGASTGGMDIPPLVLQKGSAGPCPPPCSSLTLPSSSSRSRSAVPQLLYGIVASSFRSWSWTKSCSGARAVPRSS